MITLLIVDDHPLFRRGLRQLCEINGGFVVVAEAATGQEAVQMAHTYQPDVILMDLRLPDLSGAEATRRILAAQPATHIVVLTMYRQDEDIASALQAGAHGYLLKNCDEETLFEAIRAVQRGEAPLDPSVAAQLVAQYNQLAGEVTPLTEDEMAVLRLVAQGADNQSIAQALHLSTGTVGNRLRSIYRKLNVSNRTEAALYALRKGWASLQG